MAEFLVIRLDADPDAHASWIVVDSDGTRRGRPEAGPLADAARRAGDRQAIVLVPAGDTTTFAVDLPARGARLRAALPFALEDYVADEVEELHFAAGKRLSNGKLPVTVVSRGMMEHWLERLEQAGISVARVIPENHGLAIVPNTLSLLATGNTMMFNDGSELQFVIQDVSPADVLASVGAIDSDADEPDESAARHLLVYCESGVERQFEGDWAHLRQELSSVDIKVLPDGVLPTLAVTVASGAGVNLLQGEYGEKTDFGAMLRPWKYAAILLVAMGAIGFIGKAVDYYQLSAEETVLKEQFTAEYRKIRPGDSREIVDPVAILQSLRRGSQTATAPPVFLPTIEQLAVAISATEDAEISVITYRAGVVDVRLTAPDVATLDQIQKSVSDSGRFTATIRSTDRVGERVNSQIQIREAGS